MTTSTRRAPRTAFKPGTSGNPGGRPKVPERVREAFQDHSLEALEVLLDVMQNGERDSDRVRAAEVILDRAWGRAPAAPEDRLAVSDRFAGLTVEKALAALGVPAIDTPTNGNGAHNEN